MRWSRTSSYLTAWLNRQWPEWAYCKRRTGDCQLLSRRSAWSLLVVKSQPNLRQNPTEDYLPRAIRSTVFGCGLGLGLGAGESDVGQEWIGRDSRPCPISRSSRCGKRRMRFRSASIAPADEYAQPSTHR